LEVHSIADDECEDDTVYNTETAWDNVPAAPPETSTVGSPGSDETIAVDDQFKMEPARRVSLSPYSRPPSGRRPSSTSHSPTITPRKRAADSVDSSSSIRRKHINDEATTQLVDINTLKALLVETRAEGQKQSNHNEVALRSELQSEMAALRAEFITRRTEDQ